MSIWTSLRDSVESGVGAAVHSATGLSLTPALSVGAGGTPHPTTAPVGAVSAAPSGAVGLGGLPNKNPSIFSVQGMTTQTMLLIGGAVLLLLFMFKKG